VPAQIVWHMLARDDRAIGGVTADARRTVANHLLAHIRPQAIGADQKRAGDAISGRKPRGDRTAVLIVADDFAVHPELDQRMRLATLQEHAMKVTAVNDSVGIAEAGAKGVTEIEVGDFAC